ncbi:MAG: PEGA domain-containing protein [Rhodospirillaceae bacterium]|nr:PEGA domain-containing protein [Rhodospirillales bacterium]
MIGRILGSLAIVAVMTGCSAIIEGTTQILTFNTSPQGANCALTREGLPIGNVTTPGRLSIEKTKHNIQVVCSKEGYEDSTMMVKSDTAGATFGNAVLGTAMGGVGWAVDSASGADNKYSDVVNIYLRKR